MRIAVYDNGDYYLYIERLLSQIYEIAGSGVVIYNSPELFEFDTVNHNEQFDILIMVLDESQDSMEKQIAMAKQARETEACLQLIFIAPEDKLIPHVYSVDHAFTLARSHVSTLFIVAVQKAVENVLSMDRRVICATVDYGKRWIPLRQIYYLESINRKTQISLETTMLETSLSIQQILGAFQTTPFVRCHKSIYVNMQKIIGLGTSELLLNNQVRLPIGRVFQATVRDSFKEFSGKNLLNS